MEATETKDDDTAEYPAKTPELSQEAFDAAVKDYAAILRLSLPERDDITPVAPVVGRFCEFRNGAAYFTFADCRESGPEKYRYPFISHRLQCEDDLVGHMANGRYIEGDGGPEPEDIVFVFPACDEGAFWQIKRSAGTRVRIEERAERQRQVEIRAEELAKTLPRPKGRLAKLIGR